MRALSFVCVLACYVTANAQQYKDGGATAMSGAMNVSIRVLKMQCDSQDEPDCTKIMGTGGKALGHYVDATNTTDSAVRGIFTSAGAQLCYSSNSTTVNDVWAQARIRFNIESIREFKLWRGKSKNFQYMLRQRDTKIVSLALSDVYHQAPLLRTGFNLVLLNDLGPVKDAIFIAKDGVVVASSRTPPAFIAQALGRALGLGDVQCQESACNLMTNIRAQTCMRQAVSQGLLPRPLSPSQQIAKKHCNGKTNAALCAREKGKCLWRSNSCQPLPPPKGGKHPPSKGGKHPPSKGGKHPPPPPKGGKHPPQKGGKHPPSKPKPAPKPASKTPSFSLPRVRLALDCCQIAAAQKQARIGRPTLGQSGSSNGVQCASTGQSLCPARYSSVPVCKVAAATFNATCIGSNSTVRAKRALPPRPKPQNPHHPSKPKKPTAKATMYFKYKEMKLIRNKASTSNTIKKKPSTVSKFAVSPSLPKGLVLNSATGEISGTPTSKSKRASYSVRGYEAKTGNAKTGKTHTGNNAHAAHCAKQTQAKCVTKCVWKMGKCISLSGKGTGGKSRRKACCKAATASCLACAKGVSIEYYCQRAPQTVGCERSSGPQKPNPSKEAPMAEVFITVKAARVVSGIMKLSGITSKTFTPQLRTAFIATIAAETNVVASDITITKYSDIRRRAGGLNVEYELAADDEATANLAVSTMSAATKAKDMSSFTNVWKSKALDQGVTLPNTVAVSSSQTTVTENKEAFIESPSPPPSSDSSSESMSRALMAGILILAIAVLLLAIAAIICAVKYKKTRLTPREATSALPEVVVGMAVPVNPVNQNPGAIPTAYAVNEASAAPAAPPCSKEAHAH